jgi:hypothetical protein
MNNAITKLLALSCAALALAACENTSEPSRIEEDPPLNVRNDGDFYALLRRVDLAQKAFESKQQMVAASDVVVTGTVVAVEDGRTLGGQPGDPGALHTLVARVQVVGASKGTVGSYVYVELPRSMANSVDDYRARLPNHTMTLYLVTHQRLGQPKTVGAVGRGLPAGETLYGLTSRQGMSIEHDGQVHFPLVNQSMWL